MVRVISQGFSTPRSRHSSGEDMIDRFAAMKALGALHDEDSKHSMKDDFVTKNLVIDCCTDTTDSFSGMDSEDDSRVYNSTGDLQNNNIIHQDPVTIVTKKKERRRERNKLSAQNYRQRRRQQSSAAQKTLESLETHHKVLLEKVRHIEAEKHIVEEYLRNCVRVPWCPHHQHASPCSPNNSTNIHTGRTNPNINFREPPTSMPWPSCSSERLSPLPDNFRHHRGEFKHTVEAFRPLNMVVEENNNMPLRMTGVAMMTDGSSVS